MAVREKGDAVTIVFRRSFAVAVTWCVVSSTALGQGTLDPLDVAITLSGAVTVERGEKNSNFFIRSSSADVLVAMMNAHAFSQAPNTSMSYQWAQRLSRAPRISIAVGDVRDDMKTSTALNEVMMCFTDPAPERKAGEVTYLLQCVAWDTTRALKVEGKQVIEMAVSILAKTGDPADAYLGKSRPADSLVYVRLQD